jgi:hypothetical protein
MAMSEVTGDANSDSGDCNVATQAQLNTWLKLGTRNQWVREAYDPPFTLEQIHEKKTVEELDEHFRHGNWCLGDAPYYQNICFINQVDGGSEYMVIRDDIDFESLSIQYFDLEKLRKFIEDVQKATPEQLRSYDY